MNELWSLGNALGKGQGGENKDKNRQADPTEAADFTARIPGNAQVILATGNRHKRDEVEAILLPLVSQLRPGGLIMSCALGVSEPVEDGISFAANALIKARHMAKLTGLPVLADDSGLCVDVMNGAPGIFSARWCGKHGDDEANLQLLLNQLSDVPDSKRGASFVCAAVLVEPGGRETVSEGIMGGHLIREPRGRCGFGYDPIFVPAGHSKTTGQLTAEEKNAISHRREAFANLASALATALAHTVPEN